MRTNVIMSFLLLIVGVIVSGYGETECSKDSVQKSGDAQEVGSTNSIERTVCLRSLW